MHAVCACYIEALITEHGKLHRNDLVSTFGWSPATATRYIAEYRSEYPKALEFVSGGKYYVKGQAFNAKRLAERKVSAKEYLRSIKLVFSDIKWSK